uniref:Armadillo repeat-containing domain-containing protein n=3 Tax=Ciona intestinalis TaxID=7719 RepID=H2Y1V7_CIOIN
MASGKNYFEDLLCNDDVMRHGSLDRLVDEINETKDRTIYKFLSDSGSEDFLWSLVTLLSSSETRVASNAAYVIGSLAETELGAQRVLSLTKGRKAASIMKDLTRMLTSDDPECVINAAGTLGTLAETNEGRGWMICQPCINEVLTNITTLLGCENNWTASNAALVLARITISEDGCHSVLNHPNSPYILTRLIQSLGNDAAGRGMNSAFAIGRLLDMAPGKKRLLNCNET